MATFMTILGTGILALTIREIRNYFHEVSK